MKTIHKTGRNGHKAAAATHLPRIKESVRSIQESAREFEEGAFETAREWISEHPAQALASAFVAGLAVRSLLGRRRS